MPDLPASIYVPTATALVLGLVGVFGFLIRSQKRHLKDVVDLARESSESAKAVAVVLERLEEVIRARRR